MHLRDRTERWLCSTFGQFSVGIQRYLEVTSIHYSFDISNLATVKPVGNYLSADLACLTLVATSEYHLPATEVVIQIAPQTHAQETQTHALKAPLAPMCLVADIALTAVAAAKVCLIKLR